MSYSYDSSAGKPTILMVGVVREYKDVHSLEEFNERYSEIVDADVLQVINNFVKF